MPRKKRAKYGDYCEVRGGKLYGSVNIPQGDGTYKRKRKRVATETEARRWAEFQLNKRKYGGQECETFFDLAEWYKREFLIAPVYQNGRKLYGIRTYKRERQKVDRLAKEFGGYTLNALDADVLNRYKRERLRTVSITAVNRDFALMRAMFHKAVRRRWMPENPFDHEKLIDIALEKKGRHELDDKTVKRLLARSRKSEQPLLHYLLMVLVWTGARPSEIFPYDATADDGIERECLTWAAILRHDFQAMTIVAYKGRLRKERVVPVRPELEIVLRRFYTEARPQPSDLLFPFSSCKRSWLTLCRSARIKGVTIRAFRSYFNSWLIEQGYDEGARMLILGQEKLTTNLLYSKLTPEFIERFREDKTPTP
jgi:integrase